MLLYLLIYAYIVSIIIHKQRGDYMIYAIVMNKGGVGKTSLCTNLAAVLSNRKKKTLIIDMDAQCNCSLVFGMVPDEHECSIHDILLGRASIDEATLKITKHLFIVPSSSEMNWVEFDVLSGDKAYKTPFNLLKPQIDEIKNKYDYILIDTPPSFGLVVGNVLLASDRVLIPAEPDVFSVQGIIRVIKAIDDFKFKHHPSLELAGVVPMRVEKGTNLHSGMLESLRTYCIANNITMYTPIPKSIKFSESVATHGKPAIWSMISNPLVKSYIALAKEVF